MGKISSEKSEIEKAEFIIIAGVGHFQQAIKNINILIEGGTTAALVGHSGAGKSTIINLLPRFYDPKDGTVYIDEQNINSVTLSSLRKSISMVSQDIILFDDTIRANIAYANRLATDEEIKKATDFAAATDLSLIHI